MPQVSVHGRRPLHVEVMFEVVNQVRRAQERRRIAVDVGSGVAGNPQMRGSSTATRC